MRRLVLALAVAAAFSFNLCVGAQQVYSVNSQQDEKKDKDRDKKNKKDAVDDAVFSQAVANSVLTTLRDGLEGHSERIVLSAFDRDKMDGYLTFEDQIQAMFERYDSFRVHYRIMQSTVEGSKGVVLAEFELEEIPRAGGTPQRRQGQLKFEMERGRKGWKIVDFNPRGFFS
jgi:hypothetical protein